MSKLSVVVITYNEENDIVRCLSSVKEVADEIIVVDSFSPDRTKALCLDCGVRFYEHVFEGYSEQKNYANSLAQFDYILSIDADEVLSNELVVSIQKEKRNFTCDAYDMNRMVNYCGAWIKHGAWYPNRNIRLFNKRKGEWVGQIHEVLRMHPESKSGFLKGDILHYSYTSIEGHIRQFDKFTTLSAIELHQKGKKATFTKLYLSPLVSFIKGFFIRLGFLDGHYGVLICIVNSFATYMKYAKLKQLNQANIKN